MTIPAMTIADIEPLTPDGHVVCGHRLVSKPVPETFRDLMRQRPTQAMASVRRGLSNCSTVRSCMYDELRNCMVVEISEPLVKSGDVLLIHQTLVDRVFSPSPIL